MEESKDVCVAAFYEAKVKEDSVLEMEERKSVSNASGDVNVALECEERKDLSVSLIRANVKEILVVESEEKTGVPGEKGVVPVLELKEKKDVSFVPSDPCVATARSEAESALHSSATGSSASFSFSGKKLLVLDLNGLLLDIVSPPPKGYVADINISRHAIFKRPFCDEFLKFCFEKFEVGIWSSRNQKNVDRIIDFLVGDMKSKLLFCWDMSRCTKTTVGTPGNRHKYVVFKELKRLWEKHDPDLPWQKGYYNETDTLLIDDSPYKALLNPPHTAIFPHSYYYQNNRTDNSLGEGGDLRLYLEKLAEADNVQEFIKMNPFGQGPLTEASESFEFYSQIIRKLKI